MPATYRTLGDLRSRLRTRLGYSSAGATAGVNQEILNSFLQGAQELLYWTHDWARLRRYTDTTVGLNQYLIDYPTTAHPDRIKAISVERNTVWSPALKHGITPQMYTTQSTASWPQRWEPYEQIELWPKADQVYPVRIFFVRTLLRFEEDDDRSTLDDALVFLHAMADAKGHYKHKDAAIYGEQRDALLARLKAKSWGKDVFNPYDFAEEEQLVKPVVV